MTSVKDDSILLKAFREGERWAEREVFDRFFGPLTLYANKLVEDLPTAQDIASDVLIMGIERRQNFIIFRQFGRFLYLSVHNASINHVLAEKRRRRAREEIRLLSVEEEVPHTEVIRTEVLREIYQEIEQLPDRAREIFKLVFIEGLSTEEIGRRMGIDPQTVRSQKSRAIGIIRTALLKKGKLLAIVTLYSCLGLHS